MYCGLRKVCYRLESEYADFPRSVRQRIIERDEGRCVYSRPDGERCALEVDGIHHIIFTSSFAGQVE
jgi:hypothetical protein